MVPEEFPEGPWLVPKLWSGERSMDTGSTRVDPSGFPGYNAGSHGPLRATAPELRPPLDAGIRLPLSLLWCGARCSSLSTLFALDQGKDNHRCIAGC